MGIVASSTHDSKHADTVLQNYVTITLTGIYIIANMQIIHFYRTMSL